MLELFYSWCVMLLDYVLVLFTSVFEGLAEQSGIGQQHRDDHPREVVNPTGINILCYYYPWNVLHT